QANGERLREARALLIAARSSVMWTDLIVVLWAPSGMSVNAGGEYATVSVAVLVLPAASRAVTVSTFDPDWSTIPLALQLVVPVAVPLPPRLLGAVRDAPRTPAQTGPAAKMRTASRMPARSHLQGGV